MSYGMYLEAVYADGFRLIELPEDLNPYGPGNTFTAVLSHAAAAYHGPLVRLSLVPEGYAVDWTAVAQPTALASVDMPDGRLAYSVDWTAVPPDAVPVVERRMAALMTPGAGVGLECQATRFGFRCRDPENPASTLEVVQEF